MKALILGVLFVLSASLQAKDYGWKHVDYKSVEGVDFSLDVNLSSQTYSFGTSYGTDIWVHVDDFMVTSAKAVVMSYFEGQHVPFETKEVTLSHNPHKGVFEAPVPYGMTISKIDSNYNQVPTYQEIALCINGKWIKANSLTSNFYFNILKLFGIR